MKCACVIKVCLLLALWACGIARAEDYVLDFFDQGLWWNLWLYLDLDGRGNSVGIVWGS